MFGGSTIGPWRQCNAVSPVVTATQTGPGTSNGIALAVKVLNGAAIQVIGPRYQSFFTPGITGVISATGGTDSASLTPAYTNSAFYGAVNRNDTNTISWIPVAGNEFFFNITDVVNPAAYGFFELTPTTMYAHAAGAGSSTAGIGIRVKVILGAAASPVGASVSVNNASGTAPAATVTTTGAGSRVYASILLKASPSSVTANGVTTISDDVDDSGVARFCDGVTTAATGTPGAVTVGGSGPSTEANSVALLEILAAGTIIESISGPGIAADGGNQATNTDLFSPPPGSLLVATVQMRETAGLVSTMTVSGGGLTWTEQIRNPAVAGAGYSGIWTAPVPANPTSGTITAGVPVVAGAANGPANAAGGFAAVEFPAAAGGAPGEDESAPPALYSHTSTSVSTARFTPPMGSLLAALVSSAGTNVGVQVTDDNGSLIWTEQAAWHSGTSGYCGVWTAVVVCG